MNRREAILGTLAAAVAASAGPSAAVPATAPTPLPAEPVGRILVDGYLVPEGHRICLRGFHPMPFAPSVPPVWHYQCVFSERFK